MPNVEYIINKVPLGRKQTDLPAHFPELFNLHLDLMENKKKLKSGLPNLKDTPNNTEFDKRRPDPSENPNLFLKEMKTTSSSTKGKPINADLDPDDFDDADDFGGDDDEDDNLDDDSLGADLDDDEIDDDDDDDDDDTHNMSGINAWRDDDDDGGYQQ